LLQLSTKENALTANWQYVVDGVRINVAYHFRIEDKSLVLTVDEPTGKVYRLDFGHPDYEGTKRLVDVPYLSFTCCENAHGGQPFAMLLDNQTFLFTMLDWTVSDATAVYGPYWDENPPRINGGCVYLRKTDGRRNPFHERIVLTASDDYLEVLPNLPNPSGQRKLVSKYFFFVNGGIPYFPFETMHRFGVENILYFIFGDTWVGPNEYGFFRDEIKADVDKEIPKWLDFMKSLGYRQGGYIDFLAIDPANKFFRDDAIVLGPDRSFMEDILNSYRPKIPYALDVFKKIEPEIRNKYQTAGFYFDTYSAFGSTEIYDLDAKAWGAGRYRTGAEAIAKMMDLTKKSHTISFSEGKRTYEYAGYVDVDYGTLGGWDPAKFPMLPAFNLYQIHSKTAMIGGFGLPDPPKTELPRVYGQRRAFLIAYGMGDMQITFPGVGYAGAPNTFSGFLKNYFLFYAYQQSCMPANVTAIQYYDDAGKPWDTSAAIKRNLVEKGRLRVTYDNGLDVWVNYSSKDDWRVNCQGQEYLLPPYGFVFAQGDDLLGFAALRDGVKLEYIRCPDYVYLDTHGKEVTVDDVTANGEVLIKRDGKDGLYVIPTGGYLGYIPPKPSPDFKSHSPQRGCRMLRFTPESLGMNFSGEQAAAIPFDDEGQPAGNFAIIHQGKAIELHPSDKYQKYRIAPAAEK
jgi:hypothetical protein